MQGPKNQDSDIPKKIDRYELKERIGAGGMGLIYKGLDTRLKRPVAIKIISDRVKDESIRRTMRDRFLNEARAAGGMSHPHLVQIYDFGETEGLAYIVMEHIEGETLEELLRTRGPLNIDELLRISKEMASGLAFAHRKGIVHRDIKPSNIMIEANSGLSKILDFGIAKFVNEEEMKLTSTGMVLGSTHYLSPEHITGKNLDGRSDIFCLGTLLYEASTGLLPFRGSNSSSILYKIVHFDPPTPRETRSDIPEAFSNFVMRCLKKNPADRFQKCEDIEREIVSIQSAFIRDESHDTSGKRAAPTRSYFVRDSQLLAALQATKRITSELAQRLRGKPVVPTLFREELISEDELAKVASECLNIPWIPRGRLKSLKISDQAFATLPSETMRKYHLLPFFRDDQQKILSILIDGFDDFRKDSHVVDLMAQFQVQFYVGGRQTLERLIDSKLRQKESGKISVARLLADLQADDSFDLYQRRVLLIDNLPHHHEALIRLFKRNESSLVIAKDAQEALLKIQRESFDHIWAYRPLLGDELQFETTILKHHPSCDIRFYENLGQELFQDSINYTKFRDFFNRMVQRAVGQLSANHRQMCVQLASLAVRVARPIVETTRAVDEVYFSVLFWKWDRVTGKQAPVDFFDGVFRFRHIFDCIGERFDGRGPHGLKAEQIPFASRMITALMPFDAIHPDVDRNWTEEEVADLKSKYSQFSGKQLDPKLTTSILELLRPTGAQRLSKIAIVDSDSAFSSLLAAQLKQIDADAKVYNDGVSALAGMKREKPDLVISEVAVAKLDGFALCARLRADELLKAIPVVFLTESQAPEHSTKAMQLGADDFIQKTAEPSFILAKIERLLKRTA